MEKIDLATGEIKSCAKLPTSWVKIAATAYKVNKLNRLLSFIEARENFVSSCMFCKTLLLLQYFPQKLDDHKYVKTMRLVSWKKKKTFNRRLQTKKSYTYLRGIWIQNIIFFFIIN